MNRPAVSLAVLIAAGAVVESQGLITFYIENAWEHPSLASVAGDEFTGGTLVPGRPSFDVINFFEAGNLNQVDPVNRSANVPNEFLPGGQVTHDSIDGIPGNWAGVVQGCVLDMGAKLVLPVSDDFGVLSPRAQVQGEPPNQGRLVFTEKLGNPPTAVVVVWSGQSYEPPTKGDDELRIPPAVQDPARISFSSKGSRFVGGDVNADGRVDIADAVWSIEELFRGGPKSPCADAGDADDDSLRTIGDAVYLLCYLFIEGSEPEPPFHACGVDETADDLGCASHAPCT